MIETYRSFNFIICDTTNNLCSGCYFNIINIDNNIEAVILRDVNFSLFQKNDIEFDIYLSKGNIYNNISKILNFKHDKYHVSKFKKFVNKDNFYRDEYNNIIKFYSNLIEGKTFISNPHFYINRGFLDKIIDNL